MGLVAYDSRQNITYQEMYNLGKRDLVYNGELMGVTKAIEHASSIAEPGHHFKIYSDNQAGLLRLKTPSDNPGQACQIRAITAAKSIAQKGASVSLNWVPGHEDVQGNETADGLAKTATTRAPDTDELRFALAGLIIKQATLSDWAHTLTGETRYSEVFGWRPSLSLKLPMGIKREVASAYYQLKLRHGYIKDYLFTRGHTSDNKCRCGARETTEHLLLSCRLLNVARAKVRDQLNGAELGVRLLLGTKLGIELVLVFLKETGIVTRAWHLERASYDVFEE